MYCIAASWLLPHSCLQNAISHVRLYIVDVAGTTQSLTMSTEYHFTLRLFSCNTGRIVVSLMPDSSLSDLRGEPHCTFDPFQVYLAAVLPPDPSMQIGWCPLEDCTNTKCCWHIP